MSTLGDRPTRATRSAGKQPAPPASPTPDAPASPTPDAPTEPEQPVPSIENDNEEEEIQRLVLSLRQNPGQAKTIAAAMAANQAASQTLRPLAVDTPATSPHRERRDRGTVDSARTTKAKKRCLSILLVSPTGKRNLSLLKGTYFKATNLLHWIG